ncbi:hypothetical protein C1H46_011651 [Malus baccata]|uniref:Uncharacterized protein n=1 Tax=Malus baccata TaxID=106549 RepID=A0A540MVB5_MALBA|nr:hypothetical protein C1H46_011651 [Malus baccata]
MEENHVVAFESISNDDHHDAASTTVNDYNNTYHTHANNDHGWQKRILEAQKANVDLDDVALVRSKLRSDDKDKDNSDDEAAAHTFCLVDLSRQNFSLLSRELGEELMRICHFVKIDGIHVMKGKVAQRYKLLRRLGSKN